MKIARAQTPDGIVTGTYKNGSLRSRQGVYQIGPDANLLAPVSPSTLYCVGRNYMSTNDLMDYEHPTEPDFFIKPCVAAHPPESPIPYPTFSNEVTYAGELAAVVGEKCRNVSPDDVEEMLRGYTIMNDVDALDQDGRTARKAFDGSAPLGPWIETDIDPININIRTLINGEERQRSNTESMLFNPHDVVSYLSERLTLLPDDVIAFGSPANPGLIEPGDEIEITYEGIGTLRNTVETQEP